MSGRESLGRWGPHKLRKSPTATSLPDFEASTREPFPEQLEVIEHPAKRKIAKTGRRFGKSTTAASMAAERLAQGQRTLYGVPTEDQLDRFWYEVKRALAGPIANGTLYKNETKHTIEVPGTRARIRAKTAFNADTLRGDDADFLILDEYQHMKEDAWGEVGAPMLLDNNGDALFLFTKARGKHHSMALLEKARADDTGRWAVFEYPSMANPHLSQEALQEITKDMTREAYRREILSEDVDDDPRALWTRDLIDQHRRLKRPKEIFRIVVAVDPQSTTGQTGIIVAGVFNLRNQAHAVILEDATPRAGVSPATWGVAAVAAYNRWKADRIIGETNHGGDMVEHVIRNVEGAGHVSYKTVRASRGKAVRAEPVQALYEKGRVHHMGEFPDLEDEMCSWVPGVSSWSPNRVDALVYAVTDLIGIYDWV